MINFLTALQRHENDSPTELRSTASRNNQFSKVATVEAAAGHFVRGLWALIFQISPEITCSGDLPHDLDLFCVFVFIEAHPMFLIGP
jgi:hypothetical protein